MAIQAYKGKDAIHAFLRNGLEVFAVHVNGLQSSGIALGVKYGSIDDQLEKCGSAHFLEHMIFKGTDKRTPIQIFDDYNSIGAYLNAFTEHELTLFEAKVFKDYTVEMLELMSDIIINSKIRKHELELERGTIISESRMYDDDPEAMFAQHFLQVLYNKNPIIYPIQGTEKTIKNLTREDILSSYQKYYNPKNMALAVYGGMNADKTIHAIEKYFSNFDRAGSMNLRKPVEDPNIVSNTTLCKEGLNSVILALGLRFGPFDPLKINEYASLMLISDILSKNLFNEVREKRGLAYSSNSTYTLMGTYSYLAASSQALKENKQEVMDIMLNQIRRLESGKISEKELEISKRNFVISNKLRKENSLSMSSGIVTDRLAFNDFNLSDNIIRQIGKIDIKDIKDHSRNLIKADNCTTVVVEPE
ncbi:MAG: insulinase family protein [Candidatus Marsarchaeota archaeon]|nr:insulinase family protein [Candidatus Marsarchaeota archaeon]MCL5105792.1 insulinase family protein [Candidatus Marsarchaeota archaeon]